MNATAAPELECVEDLERASILLNPQRLEILGRLRSPGSAAGVAGQLGVPRQRVNYHVRELEEAGLLRRAGRRRKRNLIEQLYVATARSYLLSPALLGPLTAAWRKPADEWSAAYLLAVTARLQGDLVRAAREAGEQGKRLATFSMDAELRFEGPDQRRAFAEALREAVTRVVAEHSSPDRRPDGGPGPGRPYRLVLGCCPIPPEPDPPSDNQEHDDD